MGRALAAFVLGVLTVLAAIGFAMYYGLIPRGIQIVSLGTGGATSTNASSTPAAGSAATSTAIPSSNSSSSDVVGSVFGYVLGKIGSYISGSRYAVAGFFSWLLGSSLADAVANLIVLIIVAGILYWLLKLFKWIVVTVVLIDAVLIVLKYVLMVI
jgi:O-antigen ligase